MNEVSLAEESTVSFTCESRGSPNLAIEWYHNQNLIAQANGNAISSKYSINSTSLGNDAIHSTLTITTGLKLADSGEVTCMAITQCDDDFGVSENRTAAQTATLTVVGEFTFSLVNCKGYLFAWLLHYHKKKLYLMHMVITR